jgi:hypothetical protein
MVECTFFETADLYERIIVPNDPCFGEMDDIKSFLVCCDCCGGCGCGCGLIIQNIAKPFCLIISADSNKIFATFCIIMTF